MSFISLTGRLVADPELKYTQSGTPLLNMRVAENHRQLNKQTNQWEDVRTDYHDVAVWRKPAETLAETLRKGSVVTISGSLESRAVERDGSKRVYWTINAREVGIVPVPSQASSNMPPSTRAQNDPWSTQGGVSNDQTPPF